MKNILIATLFVLTVFTGCKDDTPVVDTPTDSGSAIDKILGKYTCNYKVFNAKTGVEAQKGTFACEIWTNTDDDTRLTLFHGEAGAEVWKGRMLATPALMSQDGNNSHSITFEFKGIKQ